MHPYMNPDAHFPDNEQRAPLILSSSQMIAPENAKSRGLLTNLAGYPSSSEVRAQAPGSESGSGLPQPGNLTCGTPSEMTYPPGVPRMSSHLPTPQSLPMVSLSHIIDVRSVQPRKYGILPPYESPYFYAEPDPESTMLPTEFRFHESSSSPPFRTHPIPTPESSPLVARFRSNGPYSLSHIARASSHDGDDSATPDKGGGSRSRASTPPRTLLRQASTRPVTPVLPSRPTTPVQWGPSEQPSASSSRLDNVPSHGPTTGPLLQRIKDETGGEAARVRAQLIENHLAYTRAAESRRPDYFKRAKRLVPSTDTGAGSASPTSDLEGREGSSLWSATNVRVIDSPAKGKRIALFQETSEESFEESLMAGGYGRYRSDRPGWKPDEDAEVPKRHDDAMGEEGAGSGAILTEEEERKKARLAAFLDPPQGLSSMSRLSPVEIEGRGRVLMKVESPEPQTPSRPTPKAKRSRKRKKVSADMKQDCEGSIAAPEDGAIDGPNWPDTEFPWRSRQTTRSAEREERLRCIENFFDRNTDEDDVDGGHSSSGPHSPDETSSRNPRPGQGKMYPLLSHSKDRRSGSTILSVIPGDPADAKTALLSKKSVRAVQLRLLRRRNTERAADSDNSGTLCICQGRDDGRPLVQCDACQTWYHLECIGIQSTSELGREEDPWFCANCAEVKTPPPVVVPLSEPTFVPTDDGEHDVGRRGGVGLEGSTPLFLNAGLNPSPATPWTRSFRPPMTPPRTQHVPYTSPESSWDEAPSSSSGGGPRTPQFGTAPAIGDMVRVCGMTPGRSLEASWPTDIEELPFDPTSTPSRGIKFGLPFTTPKDGRLGMSSWQGVRGNGHELFHTPRRPGEDGGAVFLRNSQPLLYHGRNGEVSEEGPSAAQGLHRAAVPANVTPIERDGLDGPRRMHVLESPLGAKRSRRTVGS